MNINYYLLLPRKKSYHNLHINPIKKHASNPNWKILGKCFVYVITKCLTLKKYSTRHSNRHLKLGKM